MKLKKLNKSFYDKSYYQSEKIPTRKILKTLFKYVLYYKKRALHCNCLFATANCFLYNRSFFSWKDNWNIFRAYNLWSKSYFRFW